MAESDSEKIDELIAGSIRALVAIAPLLPTVESVDAVTEQAKGALERGYFLPDEDEHVRQLFSSYLTTRAVLVETLKDLRPYALAEISQAKPTRPQIFIVSYFAACLLMRSGRFLIDSFRENSVIRKKLDEAEPRFGIPKKQFTKIYRSLSAPANIWVFLDASRYWQENRDSLIEQFQSESEIKAVLDLLIAEEPWIETSRSYYANHRMKYRLHSFLRRHQSGFKNVTFGLFKLSGSLVAEIRMKWKRKRVTPGVRRKIARLLQPGDVIVTRHDDAASNLFLPGFWPHGALYIGTHEQRSELGIAGILSPSARQHLLYKSQPEVKPRPDVDTGEDVDSICVLEARKDGVLFRRLSDTLNVDAFTVLRPQISREQICLGIARAITHEGKSYDFEFDFRRSDKLVCTEVIYRAFHGCDPIRFELSSRMGRVCLSAEDLLDTAIDDKFFEVLALYGVGGNRFATGDRAKALLIESYRGAGEA